ncbi:hypothetical protein [Neolewinella agarilytica]|uniref:TonB-dependent receptor plug domain-containing protein n=1 Tax=Neolewinella agarilytica TaxID=478744 RepID=A0A1H9LFU1_9BACT|nr:hypothetical protein [Neolewinella agarilytica]SER10361.1 hypothetical protein SAMN05444359_12423 [Neolewinella agarilytica]
MSLRHLLTLLIFSALLFSCQSPRAASAEGNRPSVSEPSIENALDLTEYIRRLGEAQITGDGANAIISIRGVTTINSDPNPLFVLNGNVVGRDYNQVYHMVDIQQLASVKILKNAGDIGLYGVQGANGIVEITLK